MKILASGRAAGHVAAGRKAGLRAEEETPSEAVSRLGKGRREINTHGAELHPRR